MKTILIATFTIILLANATSVKACESWSEIDRKTLQTLYQKGDTRSVKWFQRHFRAKQNACNGASKEMILNIHYSNDAELLYDFNMHLASRY